jgi:hypothetical protein
MAALQMACESIKRPIAIANALGNTLRYVDNHCKTAHIHGMIGITPDLPSRTDGPNERQGEIWFEIEPGDRVGVVPRVEEFFI